MRPFATAPSISGNAPTLRANTTREATLLGDKPTRSRQYCSNEA
jgi:hypothetical protein